MVTFQKRSGLCL
uniref:Uncharacterized protein n=1 Tax=Anguilla anguilla TaxID=7936 RepID=A0A0E9UNX4_ANGAN